MAERGIKLAARTMMNIVDGWIIRDLTQGEEFVTWPRKGKMLGERRINEKIRITLLGLARIHDDHMWVSDARLPTAYTTTVERRGKDPRPQSSTNLSHVPRFSSQADRNTATPPHNFQCFYTPTCQTSPDVPWEERGTKYRTRGGGHVHPPRWLVVYQISPSRPPLRLR